MGFQSGPSRSQDVQKAAIPEILEVSDEGKVTLVARGQPRTAALDDCVDGWMVRYVSGVPGREAVMLEQTHDDGGCLLFWKPQRGQYLVEKPRRGLYRNTAEREPYMGHSLLEVSASPIDLLGLEVLSNGEASWDAVVDCLPELHEGRYQILGSPLSREKYIMLPDGSICTREPPREAQSPAFLYSPWLDDSRLARCVGEEGLLDNWMPASCYRYTGADAHYELVALVDPHDYSRRPTVYCRLVRYSVPDFDVESEWYHTLTTNDGKVPVPPPTGDKLAFYEALGRFTAWWGDFAGQIPVPQTSEDRVSRWVKGCLALAATVFVGEHPKYGVRNYGAEEHDTFPPTLLDTVRAFLAWGDADRAVRYLSYHLTNVVLSDGTFNYRGPSATEYGQWLCMLDEVEERLGSQAWIGRYLGKLEGCARFLASLRQTVRELPAGSARTDLRLVYFGAEDDNRVQVNAYFSNNLWTVRGLRAVGSLLERHGSKQAAVWAQGEAESLLRDTLVAADLFAADTEVGPLIPSHLGYPADVWSLSIGPDPRGPRTGEERAAYLSATRVIPTNPPPDPHAPAQRIHENTYANYRYYLESLSSMLLGHEHAEALVRCRETRGGELLGTTRFMAWLDDWPVYHYAKYLLESERIDKYLLLYYSHMAHHGTRETLTYYEQVTFDGTAKPYTDCVNALLTIPLMTAWMLCYESDDQRSLYLCRATPRAWLEPGHRVAVESLPSRLGPVSLSVEAKQGLVEVECSVPTGAASHQTYVDIRLPRGTLIDELLDSDTPVDGVDQGYRVRLKPGFTGPMKMVFSTRTSTE